MREVLGHYNGLIESLVSKYDRERGCIAKKLGVRVDFVLKVRSKVLDDYRWKCKTRLKNYYTQVNNKIVESLINAGVGMLVIGWSDGFKSGMNIGRKNNKRDLYRTKQGYFIHADVNGAFNILRKAVPGYSFENKPGLGSVVPRARKIELQSV